MNRKPVSYDTTEGIAPALLRGRTRAARGAKPAQRTARAVAPRYMDSTLIAAMRARGATVVDIRALLPRNTTWTRLREWSLRPVDAITIIAWHYPARPLRPALPYDEKARIAAFAQGHINTDWGGGYHAPTLTYHLFIGGSGTVYVCNDAECLTWHASDANGLALGVCVDVGEGQLPTPAQITAMQAVADAFCNDAPAIPAGVGDQWGHGELTQYGNATQCPGNVAPLVRRYRATAQMSDAPTTGEEPNMDGIIAELNTQIEALRNEVAGQNSVIHSLQDDTITPLRTEVESLKADVTRLSSALTASETEKKDLETKLAQSAVNAWYVERAEDLTILHLSDGRKITIVRGETIIGPVVTPAP